MKFHLSTRTINILLFIVMIVVLAFVFTPKSWKNAIAQKFQNVEQGTKKGNPNDAPPEFATVTGVVDAITISLDSGQNVRYLGVRAPSVARTVECFGREAMQANESVVGKKVRLEKEPLIDRTQDGAWGRYVYLQLSPEEIAKDRPPASPSPETSPDASPSPEQSPAPVPSPPTEIFINERILEGGFAFPVVSPDMKHGDRLLSSARFASATGKGLWGSCKVTPDANNALNTEPATQCLIKSKVTTDLQKIYRTPECSGYAQTLVVQSQGGQWFCAEDIAKDAGFTRASDCPAPSQTTPSPTPTVE